MRKEEVCELLNEFFDTDINWSKLSKDDLMKLYDIINDPEKLIDRMVSVMGAEKFLDVLMDYAKKKALEKKPIRTLIKSLLGL